MGRSYGDAALNSGGALWDMTGIGSIRVENGTMVADGGAVLSDVLEAIVPQGFFLPVTPGTKYVTVGGAIAADVHGKNHHVDGSLGEHVEHIRLLQADGQIVGLAPGDPLFDATVGGMGLTGIILEARIRLLPSPSPAVVVDTLRTADLDETMATMADSDHRYRYSVAWIDLLARGTRRGRSVLTRANLPDQAIDAGDFSNFQLPVSVPDIVPGLVLNPLTMQAFNEAWYRKAPKDRSGEIQSFNRYFYPLDLVASWNRIYGRQGFVQYQIAVPDAEADTMRSVVDRLSAGRAGSFLVVLKRFGPGRGLLSFPIPGWTLAVDIPARTRGLAELLDELDQMVVGSGGRTYLAKDARTRAALIPDMYPDLDRWRKLVDEADPERVFQSDLDRRLRLRAPR